MTVKNTNNHAEANDNLYVVTTSPEIEEKIQEVYYRAMFLDSTIPTISSKKPELIGTPYALNGVIADEPNTSSTGVTTYPVLWKVLDENAGWIWVKTFSMSAHALATVLETALGREWSTETRLGIIFELVASKSKDFPDRQYVACKLSR